RTSEQSACQAASLDRMPTTAGEYPFAHRQRVRFGETDMQGVVYYANYLLFAEVGRVAYLRALGIDYRRDLIEQGADFTIVEASDRIPRDVIDAMAAMGLFAIGFREEVGGQGFGKLGYCVAVEQLARANASLWNVVGGSAGLCGTAIDIGGPDDLRARYLPELLSARTIGAYGLSEPGAGSD